MSAYRATPGGPRKTASDDNEHLPALPSNEQVTVYERLMPMLMAAHEEIGKLSAKKQDGILNPLKIRNINRLLEQLMPVLEGDSALEFLETLDEETLPQNSDAAFLLGQWIAALRRFRAQYSNARYERTEWYTRENYDSE